MNMADFEQLRAMITKHQKRVAKASYIEAKVELSDQLYPLIETITEEINERLESVEEMVHDLINDTLSVIHPDLAAQIAITLGLTGQLIAAIEAGQDPKAILVPLREAMRLTEESVTEATVVEDEDEDGSEEVEPEEQPAEPAPPAAVIETTAEEKK